jgi:hypothetical protein
MFFFKCSGFYARFTGGKKLDPEIECPVLSADGMLV